VELAHHQRLFQRLVQLQEALQEPAVVGACPIADVVRGVRTFLLLDIEADVATSTCSQTCAPPTT